MVLRRMIVDDSDLSDSTFSPSSAVISYAVYGTKTFCVMWLVLGLLAVVAQGKVLHVDYRLLPQQTEWSQYAEMNLDTKDSVSHDLVTARVIGALEGNAYNVAEKIWDAYEPGTEPVIQWAVRCDDSSDSLSTLPLESVKSEKHLGKILSNLEVHILLNKDAYVSANIRVPWEFIEDADVSSKRLGTVYVAQPRRASVVIEEPPKKRIAKDPVVGVTLEEEARPPPPPPEPSFFRKYWWLFLGGYLAMNALSGAQQQQPPAEAPQQPAARPKGE
eukprot:Blabericola_migrator_1__1349@NODE_1350_length_4748_cov_121_279855_g906_i0_p2_GENE_NODE_1350_length_4748_cov_121_279855_g906_i0NODE_1350_length_4748_cov_121_279855_g906_i0_p2_ORF_typecomplete_len274_score63_74_NODE_1350_length_4748_cov_121_279855_g906_i038204641